MFKKKEEIQKNEYDQTYRDLVDEYCSLTSQLRTDFLRMRAAYSFNQMTGLEDWSRHENIYYKKFMSIYNRAWEAYNDMYSYFYAYKNQMVYYKEFENTWNPEEYCMHYTQT